MKRSAWVQKLLAAILVILGGVVIAMAAETMTVKIEKHGEGEIAVDINGVKEVVRVEDLAEGEERTFDAGEHTIVVKRVGDGLELSHGGESFDHRVHEHHGTDHAVWVSTDAECDVHVDDDGVINKKIIVHGSGDSGEAQVYAYRIEDGDFTTIDIDEISEKIEAGDLEGLEELDISVDSDHHVFIAKGGGDHHGHHPIVIKSMGEGCGNYVTYRCEETGSELRVKKNDFLEDKYLDPATGCLMERVEDEDVRVVKIIKKVGKDVDEEK